MSPQNILADKPMREKLWIAGVTLVILGCLLCLFSVAFLTVSDTTVQSETPVAEYSGDYTDAETETSTVKSVVYPTVYDGPQTVDGAHSYRGAYEIDGVVYEIQQSKPYIQLFGQKLILG